MQKLKSWSALHSGVASRAPSPGTSGIFNNGGFGRQPNASVKRLPQTNLAVDASKNYENNDKGPFRTNEMAPEGVDRRTNLTRFRRRFVM